MPRLTVILTSYNRLNYIKKAIDSVLNQTFKDFDLIILDNASSDGTDEYIKSLRDERILYIRNLENIGALRNGLKAFDLIRNNITSEFVSFFHDDDMMSPTLLEKEIYAFEQNENIVLVGTNIELIDENGLQIATKGMKIEHDIIFRRYEYIETFLVNNIFLYCPTIMIKRAFIVDNNLTLKPEIGPGADTYLLFEINVLDTMFCLLHEPLLKRRIHNNQDSQINSIKMMELFYEGVSIFLADYKLNYLIPVLKKYVTRTIVFSLSNQLMQKQIPRSQFNKTIKYYIDRNIINERMSLKLWAIMVIAKIFPGVLRTIIYIRRWVIRKAYG